MTERLVISSTQKDNNKNINEVCQSLAKMIYNLDFDQTKVLTPLPIYGANFEKLSMTQNHFVVLPTYFETNNHENIKYITRMIHIIEVYKQRRFVIKYIDQEDDDEATDEDDDDEEVDETTAGAAEDNKAAVEDDGCSCTLGLKSYNVSTDAEISTNE